MILLFLACADLPQRALAPEGSDPATALPLEAAADADTGTPDGGTPDTGSACGGTAPVLGAVAAVPGSFTTEGGVQLGEDGVIDATIGSSLRWVSLSAPAVDLDGDLHAWTLQVWLAPASTPLDPSAPPTGELSGGTGAPCTVTAATAELLLAVDDLLLAPATAYHAWLVLRDAGGQASAGVELAFTTPE